MRAFLNKSKHSNGIRLGKYTVNKKTLAFIAIFAAIGTFFALASKAASPSVAVEVENATIVSPAITGTDSNASGGAFTQFKAPSTPTSGYPDATNTGVLAGISRSNSGSITTTSDGQVIQNLNVSGSIQVNHNNVRIKNVKITNPGGDAIKLEPTKNGLLIEDCELDGTGNTGAQSAVSLANFTIRRCNIHHYGEGISANGGTVIEDNYMHDFTNFIAADAHQDGIQVEWPGGDIIRHNTIIMNVDGANAGIHVSGQPGAALVENNLLGNSGGKEISAAHGTWRNNKMTDRIRVPESQQPLSRIYEYPFPHTICGTTFYDGPNAGQPVEGNGPC